jgi:hypothetical protein
MKYSTIDNTQLLEARLTIDYYYYYKYEYYYYY